MMIIAMESTFKYFVNFFVLFLLYIHDMQVDSPDSGTKADPKFCHTCFWSVVRVGFLGCHSGLLTIQDGASQTKQISQSSGGGLTPFWIDECLNASFVLNHRDLVGVTKGTSLSISSPRACWFCLLFFPTRD